MNKLENNSRRKLSESDKELLDSIAVLNLQIWLHLYSVFLVHYKDMSL